MPTVKKKLNESNSNKAFNVLALSKVSSATLPSFFLSEFSTSHFVDQYPDSSLTHYEQLRGTVAEVGEGFSGGTGASLGQGILRSVQRAGRHS